MNLIERIGSSPWVRDLKPVRCGSASCSRWLTQRQLAVSSAGVSMAGTWYCGYRCLRAAAQRQVARLLAGEAPLRSRLAHAAIGLALLRRDLLTESQYKAACQMERRSGDEFGEIVVRLGFLTESQVMQARAAQWSCPVFPARGATECSAVERSAYRLPARLMQRYGMAPLHFAPTGNKLFVGFVHEVEYEALYAVEQVMGCATQPCFIRPEELKKIRGVKPSASLAEEREIAGPRESGEIVDALCAHGISISADRLTMVRCGDLLWMRLRAGLKAMDLLFEDVGPVRQWS